MVIIRAEGKFDGTVGWLAPTVFSKVHSTLTGAEIIVPTSCLTVLAAAPSFDSDGTGTMFVRPGSLRTTTAAAPKKKAAEAPQKKAAEDITHHNFT